MRSIMIGVSAVVSILTACADAAPASLKQGDAARVGAVEAQVARASDAALADASREAQLVLDLPDAAAWLAADDFSIKLAETGCYGTCPSFWVQVDAHGHVRYRGQDYTARPGFYEVDVPEADARALRRSLIDAGFLALRDQYATEADGCKGVFTDNATYTFTLQTPERSKRIDWYLGCDMADALALLDSFEKQIKRVTTVNRFLTPAPETCLCADSDEVPREWVDTFVLTDSESLKKKDLGLLHFGRNATWNITSCEGEELARGSYTYSSGRERILLPPYDDAAPFAWPALDAPQGAAVLRRSGLASWITVRTLELLDEHYQWAFEGDRCGLTAP